MFEAAAGLPFGFILAGIIWAVALGFAAGNYACSVVYRLPRGEPMLEKKPFCGSCGTMLATKDLFPVVSALILRHRCRYCSAPIPISHFWTEVLIGLLFALCFLQFNFTEDFLLVASLGVFCIILACIESNEGFVSNLILAAVLVTGLIFRTLHDHTLYGFFGGALAGFCLGLIIWFRHIKKTGHRYSLPDGVRLLAVGAGCIGSGNVVVFLAVFAAAWVLTRVGMKTLKKERRLPLTIPFGVAVTMPLLFPQLTIIYSA